MAILKTVSKYFEEGFFDYYIKRYKYEQKCFGKGNDYFENKHYLLEDDGK